MLGANSKENVYEGFNIFIKIPSSIPQKEEGTSMVYGFKKWGGGCRKSPDSADKADITDCIIVTCLPTYSVLILQDRKPQTPSKSPFISLSCKLLQVTNAALIQWMKVSPTHILYFQAHNQNRWTAQASKQSIK